MPATDAAVLSLSSSGRVLGLTLKLNDLRGSIGSSLGLLSGLTRLDLHSNFLTGLCGDDDDGRRRRFASMRLVSCATAHKSQARARATPQAPLRRKSAS